MVQSVPGYPIQQRVNSIQVPVVFLDVSLNYGIDQSQLTVTNADAITVKIVNILYTSIGSRPFEPLFGSLVPSLIFTNVNPNAKQAFKIETAIYTALTRWMAGIITVNMSGINVVPLVGAYFISITYYILGSLKPQNVSLRYNQ